MKNEGDGRMKTKLIEMARKLPTPIRSAMGLIFSIADIFRYPIHKLDELDFDEYWNVRGDDLKHYSRDLVIRDEIQSNASILDIACGNGRLLSFLQKTRNIKPYGVDISAKAKEYCENKGIYIYTQDVSSPTFKLDKNKSFDYITLCEIIHYLPNPEDLLLKLHPHVKKEIIITIPNIGYFRHRLRLLFGRFPLAAGDLYQAEFIRFWSIIDFKWWINEIVKVYEIKKIVPGSGIRVLKDLMPNLFCSGFTAVLKPKDRI